MTDTIEVSDYELIASASPRETTLRAIVRRMPIGAVGWQTVHWADSWMRQARIITVRWEYPFGQLSMGF